MSVTDDIAEVLAGGGNGAAAQRVAAELLRLRGALEWEAQRWDRVAGEEGAASARLRTTPGFPEDTGQAEKAACLEGWRAARVLSAKNLRRVLGAGASIH